MNRMASRGLRLYELHSLSEMEKIRESWARLALNAEATTPYQTWEWNFGMAKFEGTDVSLRIVVAEEKHGEVVGVAPFWIRSKGLPGLTVLEFIGSRASDYLDFLSPKSHREMFVRSVIEWIEQNKEWRIFHIRSLRRDLVDLLSGYDTFTIRSCDESPYACLPNTIEDYERALPKNLRHNIRRRHKMIGNPDRLVFSLSRKVSELTSDLEIFFDLHQRRQRSKGERGRFFDRRWRESFQEMSLMLLQAGFLRLGILRIDGHPAACYYNLRMGEREYCYSGGMEPSYARYSPGSLLDYWMIGEAIKDGVRAYDFGLGNETYKFQWANETSHLFEMVRARSRMESIIWEKWNFLHTALYRSRLLKRIYLNTVGRFQN